MLNVIPWPIMIKNVFVNVKGKIVHRGNFGIKICVIVFLVKRKNAL